MQAWKQKLRAYYAELMQSRPAPHDIGLGFGIGTFISILPTPGLNFVIGLALLLLFKKINKISLFLALLFWNTLTLAPIYVLSFAIGDRIFNQLPIVTYEVNLFYQFYHLSRRFLIGNLILAVTISLASYGLVRLISWWYQNKTSSNLEKK